MNIMTENFLWNCIKDMPELFNNIFFIMAEKVRNIVVIKPKICYYITI